MNIKIEQKKLYGIINPKLKIIGYTNFKIKKLVLMVNGKEQKLDKSQVDTDFFAIDCLLPKNTHKVKVTLYSKDEEFIILNKNYGYIVRGMKVVTKPFRVVYDRMVLLVRPIIKTIKLMWTRHHFLIPPSKLKRYFNSFLQNYIHPEIKRFYDPQITSEYHKWLKENSTVAKEEKLKYTPLISIIIPVYNADADTLKECIDSALNQTYTNFEICIADDKSTNPDTLKVLKSYEDNPKIKIHYRNENGMISRCMNDAIALSKGEFIGFLDNDDILDKTALYYVAKALNEDRYLDLIYTDEDKLDEKGNYCEVNFKPDYSPDTLLSMNYICHFAVVRRKIFDSVHGFDSQYDGAQDYDLFLKITEKTDRIYHIPRVLYHWRKSITSTSADNSNKVYVQSAGRHALKDALARRKINAEIEIDEKTPYYKVRYLYAKEPKISIVIPTKNHREDLEKCINSIYEKTTYKNFEIVVVDNNTSDSAAIAYLKRLPKEHANITVIEDKREFNYSKINNDAIRGLKTDFILLLNNDTQVITPSWLSIMVGYAMQKHVGSVGVKLLYPDSTVQHGGVVLGIGGVASHAFLGREREDVGYGGRLRVPYNYSANTAACLMVSKKKFDEVGGLEEDLQVAYNDVDFNIKLLQKGYYNVFLPQVELFHFESKTRGPDTKGDKKIRFDKESNYMKEKWGKILRHDRFYNSNFSRYTCFLLDRSDQR